MNGKSNELDKQGRRFCILNDIGQVYLYTKYAAKIKRPVYFPVNYNIYTEHKYIAEKSKFSATKHCFKT